MRQTSVCQYRLAILSKIGATQFHTPLQGRDWPRSWRIHIQALRISAAKELLEHGTPSIQAVSSKIGYGDIGFFRNLFKRHTGMTPGEYRERFSLMSFDRGELAAGGQLNG